MPKFLVRVTLVERVTQKKLEHYNKPSNLPYDELDFGEVDAEVLESYAHVL